MARSKTTRKPAAKRRRAPPAKSGSSFGRMGWVAALALGVGWAAADGRALSYIAAKLSPQTVQTASIRQRPAPERAGEAPARSEPATPQRTRMPSPQASEPKPRPQQQERDRLAAVTPSPAPRPAKLAPMRMPRESVAQHPAAKSRPIDPVASAITAAKPVETARLRPMAPPSAVAAGGERHATRRLDVRKGPADDAGIVALIDTGTMVRVVKSDGRWRYVKSGASAAEGWVDGTFLAGESAPAPLVFARTDEGARRPAASSSSSAGFATGAPVPRADVTSPGR